MASPRKVEITRSEMERRLQGTVFSEEVKEKVLAGELSLRQFGQGEFIVAPADRKMSPDTKANGARTLMARAAACLAGEPGSESEPFFAPEAPCLIGGHTLLDHAMAAYLGESLLPEPEPTATKPPDGRSLLERCAEYL